MNKHNLKTLALSPSKQNLFLALSIGEGLGMVEEVLEWWWEDQFEEMKFGINHHKYKIGWGWGKNYNYLFMPILMFSNKHNTTIILLEGGLFDEDRRSFSRKHNLPPLPTIIKNIKDYTFALILHLWEFGEEMVE